MPWLTAPLALAAEKACAMPPQRLQRCRPSGTPSCPLGDTCCSSCSFIASSNSANSNFGEGGSGGSRGEGRELQGWSPQPAGPLPATSVERLNVWYRTHTLGVPVTVCSAIPAFRLPRPVPTALLSRAPTTRVTPEDVPGIGAVFIF